MKIIKVEGCGKCPCRRGHICIPLGRELTESESKSTNAIPEDCKLTDASDFLKSKGK